MPMTMTPLKGGMGMVIPDRLAAFAFCGFPNLLLLFVTEGFLPALTNHPDQ